MLVQTDVPSLLQVLLWLSVCRTVGLKGNVWGESVSVPLAGLELTARPDCATPGVLCTAPVRPESVCASLAGAEPTVPWTAAPWPAQGGSTASV